MAGEKNFEERDGNLSNFCEREKDKFYELLLNIADFLIFKNLI